MENKELCLNDVQEVKNEDIAIYTVSDLAFNIYRNESKNFQNLERSILERKLTAMALACKNTAKEFFDSKVYKFAGFNMITNEKTKSIEVIYWDTATHERSNATKDLIYKLKENYKLLGLSGTGNTYVGE